MTSSIYGWLLIRFGYCWQNTLKIVDNEHDHTANTFPAISLVNQAVYAMIYTDMHLPLLIMALIALDNQPFKETMCLSAADNVNVLCVFINILRTLSCLRFQKLNFHLKSYNRNVYIYKHQHLHPYIVLRHVLCSLRIHLHINEHYNCSIRINDHSIGFTCL